MWQLEYPRRKTRPVRVGAVTIGGGHPVVVQSMITAETWDVQRAAEQVMQLWDAGAEIVRITAPNLREAHCIGEIRNILIQKGYRVPLVADVHHQGTDIAVAVAPYVDKIRINPGLFVYRKPHGRADDYTPEEHAQERQAIEEALVPVIEACKKHGIAMRIGVNHGSLSERMLVTYGDTPEGMVQSAMEYIEICEKYDFRDIVISMKASRVPIMLAANRLLAKRLDETGRDYPIHLGVTEAGDGTYARIKSTAGIATLLAEGIGDTIRVSLAEDPVTRNPRVLRHPAGGGLAQNAGGVYRLSLLWAHEVRPADRAESGTRRHQTSQRAGYCRDGLYRERTRRDGRCGLRLRRKSGG
jgi:(E)-4-hydroxy-3-methylbut-2-enyl-diphosphate synthase